MISVSIKQAAGDKAKGGNEKPVTSLKLNTEILQNKKKIIMNEKKGWRLNLPFARWRALKPSSLFFFYSEKVSRMKDLNNVMKSLSRQDHPPELKGLKRGAAEDIFNADKTRMSQIPSANGHASARGEQMSQIWHNKWHASARG